MSIKDYILNNFKNDDKKTIKAAITESINSTWYGCVYGNNLE